MKEADKVDNSGIADLVDADIDTNANTNVDINRANNLGTDIEGTTGSNGDGNSKTRFAKIVSFSINNRTSHSYSM